MGSSAIVIGRYCSTPSPLPHLSSASTWRPMGCNTCSMTETTKAPQPAASKDIVLDVDGLKVTYRVRGRDREILHSLNFKIARGESYGLVGESGCGKSTAALSVMRYLPENGRVTNGLVSILGRDLYGL